MQRHFQIQNATMIIRGTLVQRTISDIHQTVEIVYDHTISSLPHYEVYGVAGWQTTSQLRQLALDMLIAALEEEPTPADLTLRHNRVAAWLPHRAYAAYLSQHIVPTSLRWELAVENVGRWLWDWLYEVHKRGVDTRYGGSYNGQPFDPWEAEFDAIIASPEVQTVLDVSLIGRPQKFVAYLAGYTSHQFCLRWLQRVLARNLPATTPQQRVDVAFELGDQDPHT